MGLARIRRTGTRIVAACFVAGGAALLGSMAAVEQGCVKEAPKPSAENPIEVGVSLGLTNSLGSFAAPLRDAVRAAEGEINANGGLLGRQVRFDIVDDRSDESNFVVDVAQKFADRGVAAVIGPVSSGQVKATQEIYFDKQIIQIAPSATSIELNDVQPEDDRFLFRTTPADDFQGAAVILLATKTPRGLGDAGAPVAVDGGPVATCNRLALVYIDNPYGESMAKVIRANFPKSGTPGQRRIVSDNKIPLLEEPDYIKLAGDIIGTNPECLAIISYEVAAAQFIKDFKNDTRYKALAAKGFFFMGTDGVFTPGFLEKSLSDQSDPASPSAAEGVYGTNPDTQPLSTEYTSFRTIFSSYFPLAEGKDAPAFAANAFDAAILIAFAIQKAGSATDRIAMRDALRDVATAPGRTITPADIGAGLQELRRGGDINYKGASGNLEFDQNGNVAGGFIVWQAVREQPSNRVGYKTVARFSTEELLEQIK